MQNNSQQAIHVSTSLPLKVELSQVLRHLMATCPPRAYKAIAAQVPGAAIDTAAHRKQALSLGNRGGIAGDVDGCRLNDIGFIDSSFAGQINAADRKRDEAGQAAKAGFNVCYELGGTG